MANDSGIKTACREAFFRACNRLAPGKSYDEILDIFEQFWKTDGARMMSLASRCEKCMITHTKDVTCNQAKEDIEASEIRHMQAIRSFGGLDFGYGPIGKRQEKIPNGKAVIIHDEVLFEPIAAPKVPQWTCTTFGCPDRKVARAEAPTCYTCGKRMTKA